MATARFSPPESTLIGVSAGLLGSLMGVGGGIIVVPALSELYGVPFREAVAISLVVIIAMLLLGGYVALFRGDGGYQLGPRLGTGGARPWPGPPGATQGRLGPAKKLSKFAADNALGRGDAPLLRGEHPLYRRVTRIERSV